MKPERWTQIETLCQEVLNLEPKERTSFLEKACAGDKALFSEIESLLNQLDSDYLQMPLVNIQSSTLFYDEASASETIIGPYRVIRTIATGGMGEVYLAVRNDDSFKQYVALKVIRKGFANEEILSRFYSERQILASLNHPGIARLYDGGETGEGLPWYAMEFVEGVPVTDYCERHKNTIEERLHIFLEICTAVQFAHQNLIVHRDLKPGNILITSEGKVKLLDFGIAKILALESGVNQTRANFQMMTPEYASPEQIRNSPVSTVSDVYALGVLLYELLTGTLPFHLDDLSAGAIEQIICNQEPAMPSSVLGSKRLSGDLDNIILKALKKDPGERYSSAEQFSSDIRRHLDGLPVIARKDSLPYRAKKFMSRHKWSVGVTSIIAALILAFGTVSFLQSAAIQARALEVEQQRDRAEKISSFLTGLFASADPSEARDESISAIELLNRGAERAENELIDQPGLQSELFIVIADVYESLGLYSQAGELARKALDLRISLYGDNHTDIATSLNALGWIHYQKGDYNTADSLLEQALDMRMQLFGTQHLDVARTLNDLAVLRQAKSNYVSTDTLLSRALEIRRLLLGNEHEAVGVTLSNYSALKWRLGDTDAAEELMSEAVAILRSTAGEEDMRVPVAMTNLAAMLLTRGDIAGAEPLYRDALQIRYQLVGEEHPDVAHSLAHLGTLLRIKGEYEEAEVLLIKSLELRKKLLGTDHVLVGDSKRTLALLYEQAGNHELAEEHYIGSIEVFRNAYQNGNTNTAEVLHLLGELYLKTERPILARPILREAMEIRQSSFGEPDMRTVNSRIKLATSLAATGEHEEAKLLLISGLEMLNNSENSSPDLVEIAEKTLAGLQ